MSAQLVIEPVAKRELIEIWEYIARDNMDAADRVIAEMSSNIRDLVRFPHKGHSRSDLTSRSVLFWTVYDYQIVYQFDGETVNIIRVLHGYRDLKKEI